MEKQNKTHAIIYSILGALLIICAATAIYQYSKKKKYEEELNNQYTRAFFEMSDYVNNIETELRKGMLVSSAAQLASISGNIYRMSNSAKSCLGELPTSEISLDNTAKFLSQVGDYTYVLSQNAINGSAISDKQYSEIESLTEYAANLNSALTEIRDGISDGSITFTRNKSGMATVSAAGDILTDLENVEKSFEGYPALIYDGPFSEHIENRESPMLKNAEEISVEQARQTAATFMGVQKDSVVFESDTQNCAIEAYNFYYDGDNRTDVSISKKGGYVVYYLKNRMIEAEKISFDEAVKKGEEFLNNHGYTSMLNSYYDKSYGVATINYAYVQNGTTCYSDLVKVKVALDNGEILGVECKGYLMNHAKRKLDGIKLSADEAKAKLNKRLKLKSSGLALIPKDSLEEVLCYEFHGSFKERNYIIYINAQNGREEKILMLLESENGVLTV